MQENTITLRLNITEINAVIKALSEKPFREVYDLIGKIHAQSNAQLKKQCAQLQTNDSIDTHHVHDKG